MSSEVIDKQSKKQAYMKAWRAANKEKVTAYQKQWKSENRERVKEYNKAYMPAYQSDTENQFATWMRNLRRNYKITPDCFNRMWDEQKGKCPICQIQLKPRGRTKDAACVDHNHATGEVRGLLCRACNHGIGNLKDSPEVLKAAMDYLIERGNYSKLTV